jgi:hypothetical protein
LSACISAYLGPRHHRLLARSTTACSLAPPPLCRVLPSRSLPHGQLRANTRLVIDTRRRGLSPPGLTGGAPCALSGAGEFVVFGPPGPHHAWTRNPPPPLPSPIPPKAAFPVPALGPLRLDLTRELGRDSDLAVSEQIRPLRGLFPMLHRLVGPTAERRRCNQMPRCPSRAPPRYGLGDGRRARLETRAGCVCVCVVCWRAAWVAWFVSYSYEYPSAESPL